MEMTARDHVLNQSVHERARERLVSRYGDVDFDREVVQTPTESRVRVRHMPSHVSRDVETVLHPIATLRTAVVDGRPEHWLVTPNQRVVRFSAVAALMDAVAKTGLVVMVLLKLFC